MLGEEAERDRGRGREGEVKGASQLREALRRGHPGLLDQPQSVVEAVKHPRVDHGFVRKSDQTSAQGQEVSGEVPAIHRGYVLGKQRQESQRVIPVVEVTPVSLEPVHGPKRGLGSRDELARRDVTEVPCGQVREHGQTHVRGRSSMRDRFRA